MNADDANALAPSAAAELGALGPAVEATRAYVQASRSARTRTLYQAQWDAFTAWCTEHALEALPASTDTVAIYLSSRAQAGRKVATVELDLTAINAAHELAGTTAPGTAALVRETMRGIRRTHGRGRAQKAPLLGPQLRDMLEALPTTLRGVRDRALLLVGWTGAFRRSELVALELADLRFDSEGLTVLLQRSKTDQEGVGRKVGLPYGSAGATCPVRATQAWLELAAITEGALFRSVDRHGRLGERLDAQDVARIVKRAARDAGHESHDLAGHSLRAGLVTAAARANKPLHVIMQTTGHQSADMVMRYIRDARLFDDNAAAGLL